MFFRFPNKEKKQEQFEAWMRACRRDRQPSKHAVLCSNHFSPEWFDRTGQTVRLREGAVPTIFDYPKHLQVLFTLLLKISKCNAISNNIKNKCLH